MPDTETALPTFQESYQSAKEEISSEEPDEKSTEAAELSETETATEPETEQKEVANQSPETTEDGLLSADEVSKLKGKDLDAYRKMQKAYTQKTQRLAAERKQIEEYQDLINQFQTNPTETIAKLANVYGLKVEKPEAVRMEQTVQNAAQNSVQELRQALGPEGEVLADRLAPVFENLARRIAESVVKAEVDPIRTQQEQATAQALASEAESDLEAFGTRHPDWKSYEQTIVELGNKFQPAVGSNMSADEYLDTLYYLASRGKSEAKATSEVVSRLNKAVKSASQATQEVKDKNVSPSAPPNATFKQAWEAAKRGEKWD
jgi:hypothetical protein